MSQSWSGRIGEGLVVGISASVMFLVLTSMNDAREELTTARETLDIQLDVNQGLVDKTNDLEERLNALDRKVSSERYDPELFGGPEEQTYDPLTSRLEVEPTLDLSRDPTDAFTRYELGPIEIPDSSIQQRIDEQRALKR